MHEIPCVLLRKGQHEEGSPTLPSSVEQCCHVVTLKTKILEGL